jgi:hypothetical protein
VLTSVIRKAALIASIGVVALLAACSPTPSAPPAAAPSAASPRDGGRGFPGVNGLVAAVAGATLQVQGNAQQTAVSFTAATRFTNVITAARADVKVGACVNARPAPDPSAQASPQAGSRTVTALTVMMSEPVNGSCDVRGSFGFGGARPSGRPRVGQGDGVRPSGGPRNFGGFGASGKVTGVNGTTFVVVGTSPRSGSGDASTLTTTVETTASTTYTRTVAATSAALAVGKCVTAIGKADSTGSVAATSIAVRPSVSGSCGFGGGRP